MPGAQGRDLAAEYEARYRPEFLGEIYALNRTVPNYMPQGNEPALMDWLQNYVSVASQIAGQFMPVYGPFAQFSMSAIQEVYNNLLGARANAEAAREYARAANTYKNIIGYTTDHAAVIPSLPPLKVVNFPLTRAGLIGMIDWQVRTLREQPGFNQALADRLGVIPPAPAGPPALANVTPGLRASNVGDFVRLRMRGAIRKLGIRSVRITCDYGDGEGFRFVTFNPTGTFDDHHPLPERPTARTYQAQFTLDNGIGVGLVSEASVTVFPAQQGT